MDIFKHLKDNKNALIAEKKFKVKQADSVCFNPSIQGKDTSVNKSEDNDTDEKINALNVSVVINTTNLLDSHGDVHISGIWNKSIKEIKRVYLLQEHQMKFDKIITDKVKVSVKNITFNELGFSELKGATQALVFDCEIDSDRNEFMFEQYLKGYVQNHSIGMQYVQLYLCINSEEKYYREEKDSWDKYISQVANAEKAFELGYFWAVTEAKIIEGSAVPIGSNYATPAISINPIKNIEAENITSTIEPTSVTQVNSKQFFINQLTN